MTKFFRYVKEDDEELYTVTTRYGNEIRQLQDLESALAMCRKLNEVFEEYAED
jgi:hypothetical protein